MKTIIIFDNGGKTLDRFTIINKETGDVFGCSENPDGPNGADKYCGNCTDHRIVMYGAAWRQQIPGKRVIKTEVDNYVNNAKLNPDWMGNEVDFNSLPVNVRQYISRLDSHNRVADFSKVNVVYMPRASENVSSGAGI